MIRNSKRIAKNTIMLYLRMAVVMIVNLYTSRVVLKVLGVTDYGIYNVVGGVALLFTFLNGTLSAATSRFLTYQHSSEALGDRKKIFNTAVTIHVGIALVIFLLAETFGLWFLQSKLVIPVEKMVTAKVLYQISICICVIQLIQIPYNAIIISNERMQVYAYVSLFEVALKALVMYLLIHLGSNKLVLFGILNLISVIIVAWFYKCYCVRYFEESKYTFSYDKKWLKPMLTFSGWDLYGNLSWTLCAQSVNILLNLFFGSTINAASAIAGQVRNSVVGFSTNFMTASQPQITKSYSAGDFEHLISLIINVSKYSFLLLFFLFPYRY